MSDLKIVDIFFQKQHEKWRKINLPSIRCTCSKCSTPSALANESAYSEKVSLHKFTYTEAHDQEIIPENENGPEQNPKSDKTRQFIR